MIISHTLILSHQIPTHIWFSPQFLPFYWDSASVPVFSSGFQC